CGAGCSRRGPRRHEGPEDGPHNSLALGKILRETSPVGGTRRRMSVLVVTPQPRRSCMKRSIRSPVLLALALSAAFIAALAGCSKQSSLVTAPESPAASAIAALNNNKLGAPELRAAFQVQEANTPGLMRVPGVVGTATTADDQGRPAILVLTEYALNAGRVPVNLGGYRVIQTVTGKIVAYKGHGGA